MNVLNLKRKIKMVKISRVHTPPARSHARRVGDSRLCGPRLRRPRPLLLLHAQAQKHRRQLPRLHADDIARTPRSLRLPDTRPACVFESSKKRANESETDIKGSGG